MRRQKEICEVPTLEWTSASERESGRSCPVAAMNLTIVKQDGPAKSTKVFDRVMLSRGGEPLARPYAPKWDIAVRGLLERACGPRNFMKKWGSLDVAGRAGQHRKPAKAGCGQNWPPHSAGAFSSPSCPAKVRPRDRRQTPIVCPTNAHS